MSKLNEKGNVKKNFSTKTSLINNQIVNKFNNKKTNSLITNSNLNETKLSESKIKNKSNIIQSSIASDISSPKSLIVSSIPKLLLKEELAIEPSLSKPQNKPSSISNVQNEGYSLTIPNALNINDQNPINKINSSKKTTFMRELENSNVQKDQLQISPNINGHNLDLGLVPIDIYTSSDHETAEQIVEARGYILQELIGSGAFANVYKAWHTTEQVYTACKMIEIKKKKKKRLNDLKHELYVLDKLDHSNIIKLYEHFIIDERVYIFLEYASCGTLSEYVRKRGPLRESKAYKWFKQICSGLYHMHSNGISHRDLKLGNILIDEYKNCKITDFGLSRISYKKGFGVFYCTSYCGTEPYMSPEILKKYENGKRIYDPLSADIWALGVCLYAMLNKAYPFNPEDKDIMISNQLNRKWKLIKKQRNKLSSNLKDLLRHLLEPDPKTRIDFLGIITHPWIVNINFEINHASRTISTVKEYTSTQTSEGNQTDKSKNKVDDNKNK